MEIRGPEKLIRRLQKVSKLREDFVTFTIDASLSTVVMMYLVPPGRPDAGRLKEFLRGFAQAEQFVRYGYNRIRKRCPVRHRTCIAERCSWYFVDNLTGDCAMIWQLFHRE